MGGKLTILVADDSDICQKVLKEQFEELGVKQHCSFFFKGDEVLNHAKKLIDEATDEEQPIQLMLLDNMMPNVIGIEVVSLLREHIKKAN